MAPFRGRRLIVAINPCTNQMPPVPPVHPPEQYPYGKVDCYGIPRTITGEAIFKPNAPPQTQLNGTDALAITELPFLRYNVDGLPKDPVVEILENGYARPRGYFVTSANMSWIPNLADDGTVVRIYEDGRYGTHDFSLFPQWYFEGTYYLPYVLRKPPPDELETHKYRLLWHNLVYVDFVPEPGAATELGMIREDLRKELIDLRWKIHREVLSFLAESGFTQNRKEVRELMHSNRGQRYANIALACAPQTWLMTLLTLTTFQRHALEALACIDYLRKWKDMADALDGTPRPVDQSIMGCITCDLLLANQFHAMGVPYWLVRPISHFSHRMQIVSVVAPERTKLEKNIEPGTAIIWDRPPSTIRHRACQNLRLGNIRIGHSSLEYRPGEMPEAAQAAAAARSPAPVLSRVASSSASPQGTTSSSVHHRFGSPYVPRERATVGRQISVEKFKEPNSSRCPPPSPFWKFALECVIPKWQNVYVHANQSLLRGYAFLDPYLLCSDSKRADIYLLAWLLFRPTCLSRALETGTTFVTDAVKELPKAKPQEWRTFLFTLAIAYGLWKDDSDERPNKKQRTESLDGADIFNFTLPKTPPRVDLYWRGEVVLTAAALETGQREVPSRIWNEVVWDLYEHNFRFELLALDQCIFPRDLLTPDDASERDDMVLLCFPGESVVSHVYPTRPEGLAAANWEARLQYVEAFRQLLSYWPGKEAIDLGNMIIDNSQQRMIEVEKLAYPFYCRLFFEYFGRAPCTPHRLPA